MGAVLLFLSQGSAAAREAQAGVSQGASHYKAPLRPAATLAGILQNVDAGGDGFPEEKTADEIAERLKRLSDLLKAGGADAVMGELASPDFRGAALVPLEEQTFGGEALEVHRAKTFSRDLVKDAGSFSSELRSLVEGLGSLKVAEFLVTKIDVAKGASGGDLASTLVRFDLVGSRPSLWRAQSTGYWQMKWRREGEGAFKIVEWMALEAERSLAREPVFTEVTESALGKNASFQRQLTINVDDWLSTLDSVFMRDSMGHHGVAVADVDGDGLDDIFIAQPAGFPKLLFRNKGDGTFEDITEASGLGMLDEVSQAVFVDVTNSGKEDLILVVGAGPVLFLNDGKGHFTRSPDAFKLEGTLQGAPMSIAIADYDRDGFVDVYLCVYSYFVGAAQDKGGTPAPYYDAQNGPPSVLLRNDGHGHFKDVTAEAGLNVNNNRYGFAAAWGDYDGDGWPDLAVANDFGRKHLYHNEGMKNGKVTFKDVTAEAGVEDYAAGMSATWIDYDNDGRPDLYFGNMWSAAGQRVTQEPGFMPEAAEEVRALYRHHAQGNSLFRNKGDGTFEDVSLPSGANFGRWAWCSDAIDFDNDGFEDLYVVNGMFTRKNEQDLDSFFWRQVVGSSPLTHVTGTPYDAAWRSITRLLADHSQASHQRNVFLRNDGHGHFDDVSGAVGLDLDQDGRSFAVADFDQDGDSDLIVMAARSAPQLRIFRNDVGTKNASIAVRLSGIKSNRDAIGARVTVETDKTRRVKSVMGNSGFISQSSKELLFGLGSSERVVTLKVDWPSGLEQVFHDLPVRRRFRIEEGKDPLVEEFREPSRGGAEVAPPPAKLPTATWFYDDFEAPDIKTRDLEGREHSLKALRGHPVLMLFWSAAVKDSVAAFEGLARQEALLQGAGVSFYPVALDEEKTLPRLRSIAQAHPQTTVVLGSPALGTTYTLLYHYLLVGREDLPLPSAFLLNERGEIVRGYRETIEAGAVAKDSAMMDASPAERLARAVPFPGHLYSQPGERNYLQYGLELAEQGLDEWGLPAFERAANGDPTPFTLYSLGTLYMKTGEPEKAKRAFERTLLAKPDFGEASNGLGALSAQGGDIPQAIQYFKAALESIPDYPDAMNNLGYALLQTGHETEAYALYQKALQLQPDFPEALNNLGIYFARQGEMEKAESFFREAVQKRPSYGEAANNLGMVLMTHDAADEALGVLKGAIEANPEFEMSYVTLARIYLSTNRTAQGVAVLERLLQRNPRNPLALQLMRQVRSAQP